jgi:hypothetical protein
VPVIGQAMRACNPQPPTLNPQPAGAATAHLSSRTSAIKMAHPDLHGTARQTHDRLIGWQVALVGGHLPPAEGLEVVDPLLPERGVGIVEAEGRRAAKSLGIRWNAKSTGAQGEYSADVWTAEFVGSGGLASVAHPSAQRADHNPVFLAPLRSLGDGFIALDSFSTPETLGFLFSWCFLFLEIQFPDPSSCPRKRPSWGLARVFVCTYVRVCVCVCVCVCACVRAYVRV